MPILTESIGTGYFRKKNFRRFQSSVQTFLLKSFASNTAKVKIYHFWIILK